MPAPDEYGDGRAPAAGQAHRRAGRERGRRDGAPLITERDIVHGLADRGPSLLALPVSLVMTRAPITCTPDVDVHTVMRHMTHLRVRHLPVVVRGRLQGIVSIGDAVKHRLDELEMETNVLRDAFLARQ